MARPENYGPNSGLWIAFKKSFHVADYYLCISAKCISAKHSVVCMATLVINKINIFLCILRVLRQ